MAPVGEIVQIETSYLTLNTGTSIGATDDATLNFEALSDGKLPKGIIGAFFSMSGTCTDGTKVLGLQTESGTVSAVTVLGNADGEKQYISGWCPADANGDVYMYVDGTFTSVTIRPYAVQVSP